ncbi:MAG TPA: SCO family protein [Blastococcus sp.]|nr:SCO family protein [Blastococcus sp.]
MIARIRLAAALAAAGLLAAGCGSTTAHDHSAASPPATVSGAQHRYAGINLADPYHRPSFTLTDTAGKPFDFTTTTAGRPTLLYFGYSRCPDVCPTTMADIAVALRGLDKAVADTVQVVVVTTDPAHDTSAVLGEYLHRFDADLPVRFVGLTGNQDAIDQAQLSAGVPLAEDDGKTHSSLLLLYGNDDQAHVAFNAGNTPKDIASDLRQVMGAS